jgi:hypothetical protein
MVAGLGDVDRASETRFGGPPSLVRECQVADERRVNLFVPVP